MKKLFTSLLALTILLGTSGFITNTYALESSIIEPRVQIFEETKTVHLAVYDRDKKQIGTISTKCTATIKYINGGFFIDSYTLSANNKKIGTTWVKIKSNGNSSSGLVVTAKWIITAEFAGPFPYTVNSNATATYNFN